MLAAHSIQTCTLRKFHVAIPARGLLSDSNGDTNLALAHCGEIFGTSDFKSLERLHGLVGNTYCLELRLEARHLISVDAT